MKIWALLWRLLAYRPWLSFATFLTWVLISLVPVALGLVSRAFFDALSQGTPATAGLWWLVVLPLMVQGGRLLITWFSVPLQVLQRFTVSALLSTNLFAQILRRPGARTLTASSGEAISCFRDDVDEVAIFVSVIRLLSVAGEVLTAIVILTLLLRINAFVTMAAVLPLLAVVALSQGAGKRLGRYRDASRASLSKVTGALGELFSMVQAIKLAGAESLATEQVRRLSEKRRVQTMRDNLYSELLRSIFLNTANLGTGLVILLAAGAMQAARFSVGDFALFSTYVGRITLFASLVGDLLARYKQAGVSLERMLSLIPGLPPEALVAHSPVHLGGPLPEVPRPSRADGDRLERLEVSGLTHIHPGTGKGIRSVDLTLEPGSFTVITGRVGAGKSTLLRALLGLLPAQEGEVRWNSRPVVDPAAHFQPPRSSYTPQVPVLFSGTLRENILQGLPDERTDLEGAIRSAVLERDLGSLEQGLETLVGARGVKLSGGQVQRTAAARMFVREPALLVFDDLSSALDVETEQLLWQRLRERASTTCLAVSHRHAALQAADQIIVLKDGWVEARGRLTELLAGSAEFRAIWSGGESIAAGAASHD